MNNFNICLEKKGDKHYKLIMPDRVTGELPTNLPHKGYLVAWPIFPHFTGETMIIERIKQDPEFSNATIDT